jgi:gluconolactonase
MSRPPEPHAHRPRKTPALIMADPGDDDNPHPSFHAASPASSSAFKSLLGPDPKISLCAENPSYPFAHEAGVYIPSTGDLFVTSNQFVPPGARLKAREAGTNPHAAKTIRVTKVSTRATPYKLEEIDADVPMANGGVNYGDSVLFCAQGTLDKPGGLVVMERVPPYRTKNILSGFFERSFNSVNDVVVADDGAIWFTDPCYGFEQGIRPSPQLPNQVYRFDPDSRDCRVVADGFDRPNGLCFDPEEEILYVTDTGYIHIKDDKPDLDLRRPSTMYASPPSPISLFLLPPPPPALY